MVHKDKKKQYKELNSPEMKKKETTKTKEQISSKIERSDYIKYNEKEYMGTSRNTKKKINTRTVFLLKRQE